MSKPVASRGGKPLVIQADILGRCTIAKTTVLDARRTIAFAAGIDDQNDIYFDDTRAGNLQVHPGIAFSLQWHSHTRLGQSTSSQQPIVAVHAGSDLRFHRPFAAGQVVTTQGRLIALKQISSGVITVERYRMEDGMGELIAELDLNVLLFNTVLADGDMQIETLPGLPVAPAALEPPVRVREISIPRNALHRYTSGSGIYEHIHTVKSAAQAGGFPDIILHGSATKAIALSDVIEHYFDGDPTRLSRLSGQLRANIFPDSIIRLEVQTVRDDDGERQVFFRVLNEKGELAIVHGLVVGRNI